ncbi:DUF4158 domain-containing protein [Streptomyces olivoreticuli]
MPRLGVGQEGSSEDQIARYGRFAGEPSAQELEDFLRLDAAALEQAAGQRRPHNRPERAVQWGTARMLGTFLSAPSEVLPGIGVQPKSARAVTRWAAASSSDGSANCATPTGREWKTSWGRWAWR